MEQRISHKFSTRLDSVRVTNGQVSSQSLEWISDQLTRAVPISWILRTKDFAWINCIQIQPHSKHPKLFPASFRVEYSDNGIHWRTLFREVEYLGKGGHTWQFSLIRFRFIKIIALCNRKLAQKEGFQVALGAVTASVAGVRKLEASSEYDRLWVKENVVDGRTDYGWGTQSYQEKHEDWLRLDLGYGYPLSELRLLTAPEAKNSESLFPKGFRILLSQDKIHWDAVIQYTEYLSEPSTWYAWQLSGIQARYMQVTILEPNQNMKLFYQSKIAEIEIYARSDISVSAPSHLSAPFRSASTTQSGMVRLAVHGEETEGIVLQSSDPRVQPATHRKMGVVELATHAEYQSGKVVQSDDPRLQKAATDSYGIARLAKPNECHPERVLRSDDPRLSEASESQEGLVRLAKSGETARGAVIQASDSRLNIASVRKPGIVQFAENQEAHPNRVIPSNDSRLRLATSHSVGITQYAQHGQSAANRSVQSDDPRIQPATEESRGMVRLARNGEKLAGSVLQSTDRRLQAATSERMGIVRMAKDLEETQNLAVSAQDFRLKNPRTPLPHQHDYAEKNHEFNSHTGTLYLNKDQGTPYEGWVAPPKNYAPIMGHNSGEGAGIVGNSDAGEGVSGIGARAGVLGMNVKNGAGVLGLSRESVGGHFVSEKDCSLIAGGSARGVKGSPYAFLSQGMSAFEDTIFLNKKSCIAIAFPKSFQDSLSEGDVVTLQDKSGSLKKSKKYGDTRVIGVITGSASLIMRTDISHREEDMPKHIPNQASKSHLVAILGIVKAKVSAYFSPIECGDLLVSANNEAGYLQKLDPHRYEVGMICARSLQNLEKGKSLLQVIILSS